MYRITAKLGFYSAIISFLAAAGYCVVQVLQMSGLIVYPLADILVFSCSLAISSPFMLAMLALHYSAPPDKKIWSHAALLSAVIYTVYVSLMYVVQLGSVIPADLRGTPMKIFAVTPQSFFWTIEGLGYIFMGVATLFAAPVFAGDTRHRWLRRFFIANGLMVPVISFVYFYPHYSYQLLLFAFPWGITMPGSVLLLAVFFKRRMHIAETEIKVSISATPESF